MTNALFRIGFANLTERSPFAVAVREGLEEAVAKRDNIELILRDNDLNDDRANANAEEFAERNADLAIFYHINERIGMKLRSTMIRFPVLTIDIPFPMCPHFGVNNQQSGEILGDSLVQWIQRFWDGKVDKVLALVDARVLQSVRDRTEHSVKILNKALGLSNDAVFILDCGNDQETTIKNSLPVLKSWAQYDRIGVVAFNADSTFGIIEAGAQLGTLDKFAVVGHVADANLLAEIQKPDTRVIATSYYDPANYGEQLMRLVDDFRSGTRLPNRTLVDLELHKAPVFG
ncbi:MAG: substrate-binding domain-containing protein [Aggregatilineales bacterium]